MLRAVGIVGPPLVVAVAGLFHPMQLRPFSADHWRILHLVLLPLFPLLALGPFLLTGRRSRLRLVVGLLGYVYAVFYTALDVLAGIGNGVLVAGRQLDAAAMLFVIGNQLSYVGVAAYLLAVVLTCLDCLRRHRLAAVAGSVVMIIAAVSFLTSHIYWPRGVLTMAGLAVGGALLFWAERRTRPRIDQ